jgi:outer membrane protein OmpA-like peptidoglycan-associated protein
LIHAPLRFSAGRIRDSAETNWRVNGQKIKESDLMTSLNDLSLLSKESDQQFEAGYPLELEAVPNPRVQVVSYFSRYAATVAVLPAVERQKIDQIARFIAGGLRSGKESTRTVRLTGHADLDTPRRPAVEYQVARARAQDVLAALAQALDRIERTTGRAVPPYNSRIAWEVQSAGATRLVVPKPRTELDRARNRRVEISLLPYESSLQSVSMRDPKFALTTRSSIDVSAGAAIDDFLRRAPNDALRYNDPDFGPDLADRRICVSAVASKAAQLCCSANSADRRGIPCRGVLTLDPGMGGRCYSRMVGSQFLGGKDYRAPLTGATRVNCCTKGFPCSPKTLSTLPAGQYLVLKYQPGPLKKLVDRLKRLLDHGCVVPVGVLSGICDDIPDLSGICKSFPLQNKWRDCWEHWLLIIDYDGDRFVFWDSAEASIVGPVRRGKDDHYFGFLYYDSTNHRFTTATINPGVADALEANSSGFHTQGVPRSHARKRYQVTSIWNGLPWKSSGAPCSLT